MQPTNVLLTCAGQRVDMVEAFRAALGEEGRGGITVACDLNPLAPALYAADARALVPAVSDPGYIPTLLELVREHALRAVLPLTDLDQRILSEQREAFAEAGATVVASGPEVADRCADKHAAARFFDANGIPSPRTWLPEDLPPYDELRFPVLVKSRRGFGSRDIYRCKDVQELEFFLGYTPVPSMVQEVCVGEEFSIDVLCDLGGRCLSAIPRSMIESKGGESIKGSTLDDPDLVAFGAQVAETLPIRGPADDAVLPHGERPPRGDRRQPALRRGVPAAARCGRRVPVARAGAGTGRAHRAAPRGLPGRRRDDALLLARRARRDGAAATSH